MKYMSCSRRSSDKWSLICWVLSSKTLQARNRRSCSTDFSLMINGRNVTNRKPCWQWAKNWFNSISGLERRRAWNRDQMFEKEKCSLPKDIVKEAVSKAASWKAQVQTEMVSENAAKISINGAVGQSYHRNAILTRWVAGSECQNLPT